jgi:hypothetical protein
MFVGKIISCTCDLYDLEQNNYKPSEHKQLAKRFKIKGVISLATFSFQILRL